MPPRMLQCSNTPRCNILGLAGLLLLAAPGCGGSLHDEIARLEDARDRGARLLALAAHPDPVVRARALRALGRVQEPSSWSVIQRGLADPDPSVRRAATFAVRVLGMSWEGLDEPLRGTAELAVLAALKASPASPELVAALGAVAGDDGAARLAELSLVDEPVAAAAGRALGSWAHRTKRPWPANHPLPSTLGGDLAVRRGRAYALFRTASPAAAPLLWTGAMGDEDAEVRASCLRGLAALKPLTLDDAQLEALERIATTDRDWRPRVQAVRALAAATHPRAAESFAHAVRVAGEAALADKARPGPLGAMVLRAAVERATPREKLRRALPPVLAAIAAARAGDAGLVQLECALADGLDRGEGKVDHVTRCGGPGLPEVERQRVLAGVLGEIPVDAEHAAWLVTQSERSPDARVRVYATSALGRVKEPLPSIPPAVHRALGDKDSAVVATAAEAAATLGDTTAVPALLAALARHGRPEDNEVAQSLVEALGKLKASAAEPALRALLSSPVPPLRLAAQGALKELGILAAPASPAPSLPPSSTLAPPRATRMRVVTERGAFVVALATAEAPATTRAIADLTRRRFYDGLPFHRVVPDFVTQGGDPRGDGWGGSGTLLRCEINELPYERGAVGMALAGKDTGGSQLFVVHSAQPHLEGRYTVFGRVIDGMEVVDALLQGDRILRATVE